MKVSAHTDRVLAEVRAARIGCWDTDTKRPDSTGDHYMVAANANYKIVRLHEECIGDPPWAMRAAVSMAEALCYDNPLQLRSALLRTASLLVAWIESIDARKL